MPHVDRMPPLERAAMTEVQRKVADELAAGPRGGVKGPFIPLLRSPELMDRLQKVGEYLRFQSSLEPRVSEFVMCIVSRQWTQQFEWAVHAPLARKAGVDGATIEALAAGARPEKMAKDETVAYDFCAELERNHGVSEATYRRAVEQFGERGLMDLIGLIGYFSTVSMVMNIAHTPPPKADVTPLEPLPV
jgi:4-carboxymuconolactone decarboxylase